MKSNTNDEAKVEFYGDDPAFASGDTNCIP